MVFKKTLRLEIFVNFYEICIDTALIPINGIAFYIGYSLLIFHLLIESHRAFKRNHSFWNFRHFLCYEICIWSLGAHLSFNRVGIQKKPFFLFWYLNARPHLVLFINHSRRLVSARTNLNARVGKARKSGGDKQTFNDLPHDEAHALLFL